MTELRGDMFGLRDTAVPPVNTASDRHTSGLSLSQALRPSFPVFSFWLIIMRVHEGGYGHAIEHTWESEGNFQELVLSLYCVEPGD